MESKFATVNGVRINYGEGPDNGPTLVHLVGFPDTWDENRLFLDILARDYRVLSMTARGLGASEHAGPYTIATWVADAAAFVREVAGGHVLGVGHSAGAWFGLSAAGADPELFRAFVALDQPLDPAVHVEFHRRNLATYGGWAAVMRAGGGVDAMTRALATVPSSLGGVLGDRMSGDGLRELAAWLETLDPAVFDAWANDDMAGLLLVPELLGWPGSYRGPVRFVYGDPDAGSMLDADARRYNRERYPWADVVEIPGADHLLGLDGELGSVTTAITEFLAQFRG